MIHVFIGTKAQFIKMMPVMKELQRRGIAYHLIDAGQHGSLTRDLVKEFGLPRPAVSIRGSHTHTISSIPQAVRWGFQNLYRLAGNRTALRTRFFKGEEGICLIHGDTLTTLISLLYAKRCGLKAAHVEAGLRSYHLFDPFPEEIIRLIVMRFSDILFAPSDTAYANLCRLGYRSKSIHVGANTGMDAVKYILRNHPAERIRAKEYILVSIHRMETIFSKNRMAMIVALVERMARTAAVRFILHEPTRRQLIKMGLLERLQAAPAELCPIMPYTDFIHAIDGAQFVVTDGGSIQEECSYLNKPCMVLRMKTERDEGIGENAVLTRFVPADIDQFFQLLPRLKAHGAKQTVRPSEVIVNHLMRLR